MHKSLSSSRAQKKSTAAKSNYLLSSDRRCPFEEATWGASKVNKDLTTRYPFLQESRRKVIGNDDRPTTIAHCATVFWLESNAECHAQLCLRRLTGTLTPLTLIKLLMGVLINAQTGNS